MSTKHLLQVRLQVVNVLQSLFFLKKCNKSYAPEMNGRRLPGCQLSYRPHHLETFHNPLMRTSHATKSPNEHLENCPPVDIEPPPPSPFAKGTLEGAP